MLIKKIKAAISVVIQATMLLSSAPADLCYAEPVPIKEEKVQSAQYSAEDLINLQKSKEYLIGSKNDMLENTGINADYNHIYDETRARISDFVRRLQENPLDINQDGNVNDEDRFDLKDGFYLVFANRDLIPPDHTGLLDRNGDSEIDQRDMQEILDRLARYREITGRISDFAQRFQENPLDINQDGRVDDCDYAILNDEFNFALDNKNFIPEEYRNIFDQNGDGRFDSSDRDKSLDRFIQYKDLMNRISEFAGRLHENPLDVNRDGRVDTDDYDLAVEVYNLIFSLLSGSGENDNAGNLSTANPDPAILATLDRNHDGKVNADDMRVVTAGINNAISVLHQIGGFISILRTGTMDINNDGVISEADYAEAERLYNLAFASFRYLSAKEKSGLDMNNDGFFNRLDIEFNNAKILQAVILKSLSCIDLKNHSNEEMAAILKNVAAFIEKYHKSAGRILQGDGMTIDLSEKGDGTAKIVITKDGVTIALIMKYDVGTRILDEGMQKGVLDDGDLQIVITSFQVLTDKKDELEKKIGDYETKRLMRGGRSNLVVGALKEKIMSGSLQGSADAKILSTDVLIKDTAANGGGATKGSQGDDVIIEVPKLTAPQNGYEADISRRTGEEYIDGTDEDYSLFMEEVSSEWKNSKLAFYRRLKEVLAKDKGAFLFNRGRVIEAIIMLGSASSE